MCFIEISYKKSYQTLTLSVDVSPLCISTQTYLGFSILSSKTKLIRLSCLNHRFKSSLDEVGRCVKYRHEDSRFSKCFPTVFPVSISAQNSVSHLNREAVCKRQGCLQCARRTCVIERIFKLTLIHSSVIYQIS